MVHWKVYKMMVVASSLIVLNNFWKEFALKFKFNIAETMENLMFQISLTHVFQQECIIMRIKIYGHDAKLHSIT